MSVTPEVAAAPALRPRRTILGISAVLLPFTAAGDVDWAGYESLLRQTVGAGLIDPSKATTLAVVATLVAAITWNLLT